MPRPAIWLSAATFALSATLPAQAATMQVTYSGMISSGVDTSGLFGAAQGDLGGVAYVLSFLYDTGIGGVDLSMPLFETLSGGSSTGVLPAPVNASLRVNGTDVMLSGAYRGYFSTCAASVCGAGEISAEVTDFATDPGTGALRQTYASQSLVDPGAGCGITGHLEATGSCTLSGAAANATPAGFFQIYRDDGQNVIENTYGFMVPDRFSVEMIGVAPVPLPVPGLTLVAALSALSGLAAMGRRGVVAGRAGRPVTG